MQLDRPTIFIHVSVAVVRGEHGLDGDAHTSYQRYRGAAVDLIGNMGSMWSFSPMP
jgi:hypothetical protein